MWLCRLCQVNVFIINFVLIKFIFLRWLVNFSENYFVHRKVIVRLILDVCSIPVFFFFLDLGFVAVLILFFSFISQLMF